MSKAAAITGLGAGGTALSLGGAYMLGAFDSDKNLEIPISLQEFQKDDGKKAVSYYFSDVEWGSGKEGEEWSKDKPQADFLTKDTSATGEGRLLVNWEKFKCSPDESGKQWGRIRWLWTFVKKDKGLILYVAAKPSPDTDSKLSVEGIVYALEKGEDNWKIKHHKKTTDKATVDTFKDKLPSASDKFKEKTNEYWGFLDDGTTSKLCKKGTADDDKVKPESSFRGLWSWTSGGEKTPQESPLGWSKDDGNWVESVYGSMDPKIKDLVSSLKGSWTKEYEELIPQK